LAVDPSSIETRTCQLFELLLELTFPPPDDRSKDHHPLPLGQRGHMLDDLIDRLSRDRAAALRAMRHADRRKQKTQIIVDLGHGADGRARAAHGGLLLDGYCRRKPFYRIDIRFFELVEELASIGRKRFDVAALALGV